jgi:hypothetical protein
MFFIHLFILSFSFTFFLYEYPSLILIYFHIPPRSVWTEGSLQQKSLHCGLTPICCPSQRRVVRTWTDVSEILITSIFRVDNQSINIPVCVRWLGSVAGSLFGWFLHPEDGGDMFLQNVGSYTDYKALCPRRWLIALWVLSTYEALCCIAAYIWHRPHALRKT